MTKHWRTNGFSVTWERDAQAVASGSFDCLIQPDPKLDV